MSIVDFRLPRRAVEGLKPLATLSDEQVELLVLGLSSVPVSLQIEDGIGAVIDSLASELGFDSGAPDSLGGAIFGLHLLGASGALPLQEHVRHVAEALSTEASVDADKLEKRLTRLSAITPVLSSAKAVLLAQDYECVYAASRVITDLRPIFSQVLSENLAATIVAHKIKITARKDGKTEDIHIAADSSDLRKLIEVLQRALEKGEALEKLIAKGGGAGAFGVPLHITKN